MGGGGGGVGLEDEIDRTQRDYNRQICIGTAVESCGTTWPFCQASAGMTQIWNDAQM